MGDKKITKEEKIRLNENFGCQNNYFLL